MTIFIISVFDITAQNVSNAIARQDGNKIQISYTLDEAADIALYVSEDGGKTFGSALRQVSGDVGEYISSGNNTIVWNVLAERDKLYGSDIAFKVKATPLSCIRFTVNGVTFEMIKVQGGTFTMGCTSEQGSDCYGSEKPSHRVTVSSFYIGKYEVTQKLWEAVMGNNPSGFKGGNLPVEKVSWNDCQEFIRKLNSKTGKTFRLPTEAEWEYAARGGNKSNGYKYSGSNTLRDVAWFGQWNGNTYDNGNSGEKTHSVGSKSPNELGIYDMSGNVYEWCQDWYGDYSSGSQTNPTGPSSGSSRVLRGGSWFNYARYCRVSNRNYDYPDCRYFNDGFRLILVQ
ncbi:MAG: formylglycine-generating enzyme family protein [Bacteroidales bacterium]|nr:formylglycine-generating enzyme family protein [Bacteroidales bacterium]